MTFLKMTAGIKFYYLSKLWWNFAVEIGALLSPFSQTCLVPARTPATILDKHGFLC
jgi:hypothetical protein